MVIRPQVLLDLVHQCTMVEDGSEATEEHQSGMIKKTVDNGDHHGYDPDELNSKC